MIEYYWSDGDYKFGSAPGNYASVTEGEYCIEISAGCGYDDNAHMTTDEAEAFANAIKEAASGLRVRKKLAIK